MATSGGPVLLEKQGRSRRRRIPTGALIRKDAETPLFDGLGSERTVTNAGQSVATSLTLSAFGQTEASTGSSTSAYQYGATSGYRTEGDAGLTLVGCRFYDAQVGRFITRDTYLNQKPYAYCDGDPINYVDPNGHSDLGTAMGLLFSVAVIAIVVIASPEAGPIFLGTPEGQGLVLAAGAIGVLAGDHLGEYLDEQNKKRLEEERGIPKAE